MEDPAAHPENPDAEGDFTVVDATNSRTFELNRYKELCGEFRYRVYCVDFTDLPMEEVKKRNREREPFRRVPEKVIDTMYARFATQKVPSGIKVIRPGKLGTVWLGLRDFSHYERIHHIGDIHGCSTALQKYLSDNGGMKEDEMYIFTGDYLDRGIENAEVMEFFCLSWKGKTCSCWKGTMRGSSGCGQMTGPARTVETAGRRSLNW